MSVMLAVFDIVGSAMIVVGDFGVNLTRKPRRSASDAVSKYWHQYHLQ